MGQMPSWPPLALGSVSLLCLTFVPVWLLLCGASNTPQDPLPQEGHCFSWDCPWPSLALSPQLCPS